MKITKEEKFDVTQLSVSKNVRSNLADEMEKYWVGRENSNIGIQWLNLKDGHVYKFSELSDAFGRKDIFLVQMFNGFNVFVEPDGSIDIQEYGAQLYPEEREEVKKFVVDLMEKEKEYVEHERRFLQEKPWRQCDGMTPQQAVDKLRELGW